MLISVLLLLSICRQKNCDRCLPICSGRKRKKRRKSNNELGEAVLVNDIRIAYVNDDQEIGRAHV